jgi:hypothetical protein
MRNVYRVLIVVLIVSLLFACVGKKTGNVIPDRKSIDPSPTKVVEELLKAWQKEDFEKAYHYVYAPYTDKEGYIIQMKNYFKDNLITIQEFHVLNTQIYDRTSVVVVEIKQKIKSKKTDNVIDLTQRSEYDLGIFNNKWKVTAGSCIKNCLETEKSIVKPSK